MEPHLINRTNCTGLWTSNILKSLLENSHSFATNLISGKKIACLGFWVSSGATLWPRVRSSAVGSDQERCTCAMGSAPTQNRVPSVVGRDSIWLLKGTEQAALLSTFYFNVTHYKGNDLWYLLRDIHSSYLQLVSILQLLQILRQLRLHKHMSIRYDYPHELFSTLENTRYLTYWVVVLQLHWFADRYTLRSGFWQNRVTKLRK